MSRETAVAREEGRKQVTFWGEPGGRLPIGCGWAGACAARGPKWGDRRLRLSAATSLISLLAGWEIGDSQEHLGPAQPGMLGPSPSHSGGLSRGPTPLLGPFCESNVITDGNGAFSFDLALRGAGSFIRFPRHQAGSRGLGCYFFLFSF